MAGIDKTYTDSYEDYMEFKRWASDQHVTFFDGSRISISDWIWDYEEEDFDNGEVPIMNTPQWLDKYLIQNCTIKFVIDGLKSVYSSDSFDEMLTSGIYNLPEDYKQNRKVSFSPSTKTLYSKSMAAGYWWLQSLDDMWYNMDTKTWADIKADYPTHINTSYHRTTRALIRFLRKQYLPRGCRFRLTGGYMHETYIITIK